MTALADLPDRVRAIADQASVDPEQLAEHLLVEAERAAVHPLDLLDDDEVARRWESALDGFVTAATVARMLAGPGRPPITRQAVSKRRDLLALRTARGQVVYPRFQFERDLPLPGMGEVLVAAPDRVVDQWSLAGWLVAPNRYLDGQPPADALRDGQLASRVLDLARTWAVRAAR